MKALLLVLCFPVLAIEPPAFSTVPPAIARALAEADKAVGSVETGRRLLAAAPELPVELVALPAESPAVLYRGSPRPTLAIDGTRAGELRFFDFELELVRARARAAADAGVALVESEQAAEQYVLQYAMERAEAPGEFRGRLLRALRKARASEGVAGPADRLRGGDAAGGLAALLLAFARDPDDFYWLVERHLVLAPGAVHLAEVEAFLAAFGSRLPAAVCPPPGRYCRLDGRLVRPELVAAAAAARAAGGAARLREPLRGFQSAGAAELRAKVERWLKKA